MNQLTEQELNKVQDLLSNLNVGELFEDEEFKADVKSLTFSNFKSTYYKDITWRRPHELSSNPQLIMKCTTRSDVNQGNLSNCWFLSACAAIAQYPTLVSKVMPPKQVLYGADYRGIVTFRFWSVGQWITVHIDDRLPVSKELNLIYARCTDPNEFWLPLLEKAYAKFQGNYQQLNGGQLDTAFIHLTGRIVESINLKEETEFEMMARQKELHIQMLHSFNRGSLLTCARMCGSDQGVGLAKGHAYTITHVVSIEVRGHGRIRMVRVRDPCGLSEWKGEWNCSDPRWNFVEPGSLKIMDLSSGDDCEFWMPFSKFITEFKEVVISAEIPNFEGFTPNVTNNMFTMIDNWVEGQTAGGCAETCWENFAMNPQYMLEVLECDKQYDNISKNIIVELIQDSKQWMAIYKISVTIFKVNSNNLLQRLTAEDLKQVKEADLYSTGYKTVVYFQVRLQLEPGTYVIVPSTYEAADQDFVLRVFSLNLLWLNRLPSYLQ